MNEEFEHGGKRYKAVDADKEWSCKDCAILINEKCADLAANELPECEGLWRADGEDKIFKEVVNA